MSQATARAARPHPDSWFGAASRSDTAAMIDDFEAGAYPPDIAVPVYGLAIRLTEVGHRHVARVPR